MNGDVKFIQGVLYYEQDKKWYPVPLARRSGGGGGGGGLSQSTIISLINQFGGDSIESGTFIRTAAETQLVQTIGTVQKPKLIFFSAVDNGDGDSGSDGKSNLTFNNCINIGKAGVGLSIINQINCISVWIGTDAWDAVVSAINDDNFQLTWAKTNAGTTFTVQWIAITGA